MADEKDIDPRAALLERVWQTPGARPYLEEAIATAIPNVEVPGRQARIAVNQVLTKVAEREQVIDKKINDWESKRDRENRHGDLRQQGFNEQDITAIEKLMVDEGIGTHANAALVYKTRTAVATPRVVSGGRLGTPWGRGAGDYFRGILDGDFHTPGQEWMYDKIDMISNDFANGKGDKWLDNNYWPASPNFPEPKVVLARG